MSVTVAQGKAMLLTNYSRVWLTKDIPPLYIRSRVNYVNITIDQTFSNLNVLDNGYYILGSINLIDVFTQTLGRNPMASDAITFTIPSNVAIVANDVKTPAINVGIGFAKVNSLQLVNNGLILGRGGRGAIWDGDSRKIQQDGHPNIGAYGDSGIYTFDGGDAIHGGEVQLNITNNGGICGGGAGGYAFIDVDNTSTDAALYYLYQGGGGAPYGQGGSVPKGTFENPIAQTPQYGYSRGGYDGYANGSDAGFKVAGSTANIQTGVGHFGSYVSGGGWGRYAVIGQASDGTTLYGKNNPGYIYTGNVNITNRTTGYTYGR